MMQKKTLRWLLIVDMKKNVQADKIYNLNEEDVLEVMCILSKGRKLDVLEAREDCNVVICKVNRKIYFFGSDLYNLLIESKVLV